MSEERRIALTVNGAPYEGTAEVRTSLADFLRGELGLTGTHVGCEHGVCGACTVLLDGRAVRSCLVLAVQAQGTALRTVEGLSPDGRLHPIQQAFLEEHGLQCGFCTPGLLMSLVELLEENPEPDEKEILEVVGGHLCRCTGYQAILRSVHSAVAKLRARGAAEPEA